MAITPILRTLLTDQQLYDMQFNPDIRKRIVRLGYGIKVTDKYSESLDDIINLPEYEAFLDMDMRTRHTLVVGTTGSGKTVLLSHLVKQDIMLGNSLIYVDPKGDTDLFKTLVAYSQLSGRFTPDEFIFLSPLYPEYSVELNPLWGLAPDEAAVVLASSIPDGKEPFFKKVAFMILLSICLAKAAEERPADEYPSIHEIAAFFQHSELKELRKTIITTCNKIASDSSSRFAQHALDAKLVLDHLTASDPAYFEKISMTLKAEIDVLTTGTLGQIIGRAKTNKLFERLRDGKRVIFVAYLGALRFGDELVGRGAKMIFSSVQRLVGQMYGRHAKFNPPVAIYGDEAKNLFYDGIEDLFNKVRGAGAMLTFATQSIGDIVAAIGQDKTEAILGNTNTQIFMKSTDSITPEFVVNKVPEVDVYAPNFVQHQLGVTQKTRKMITNDELGKLKPGSYFALLDGHWYQMYTPFEKVPAPFDFEVEDVIC